MLLAAGTTNASTKVSLLGAWLTDDGRIEGLLHEVIADLHAYERWCVGTKPAAQAAEAVKKQVQKRRLYWLNANTVKGARVVHTVSWSSLLHKLPGTPCHACKKQHHA